MSDHLFERERLPPAGADPELMLIPSFRGNSASSLSEADLERLKGRIHERLLEEYEPAQLHQLSEARLEELITGVTAGLIQEQGLAVSTRQRGRLIAEVSDELTGFGPLQPFLDDPTVAEIMVNGAARIYVERAGRLERTGRTFSDATHVMRVVERILSPLGRRVDESSPMVDARLPDGSRVNVIIPPVAVSGPTLTIRKFGRHVLSADDLIAVGTLTPEMAQFLRMCVAARMNVLISGGTGSGKTTTLNVLSSFIGDEERIVTIEDAAELQLQQEHVVTLESRPPNLEGAGEVTIRMLVRNALRMRPERIVVGEVRGGETLDMLQAMNTGHDGSLTTLHSNSPRDSLSRLETLVLMAGIDLPTRAIREQIASALNIIVHQSRLRDGTRRITHITEVQGMEGEVVVLQDIFRWEQQGVDGEGRVVGAHHPTGLRPRCVARFLEQGLPVPPSLFGGLGGPAGPGPLR